MKLNFHQIRIVPHPTIHHFVTEMYISVTKLCIAGYLSNAVWDLWDGSTEESKLNAHHPSCRRPFQYEDAIWLSYLCNGIPIPGKTVLTEMYISVTKWCIMGYLFNVVWDLWDLSTDESKLNAQHSSCRGPYQYEDAIWLSYLCNGIPIPGKTVLTEMYISVTKWRIVGYLSNAVWDLWDGSTEESKLNAHHPSCRRPFQYEDAIWLSYLCNGIPIPGKTVLTEMYISVTKLCIAGYLSNAVWDLWDGSTEESKLNAHHPSCRRPFQYEDAIWLSYLCNGIPIPGKTVLTEMYISVTKWCIMGYLFNVVWDLWDLSTDESKLNAQHSSCRGPYQYEDAIWLSYLCNGIPIPGKTVLTEMYISVTKWRIVGYLSNAVWDLWDGSTEESKLNAHHPSCRRPFQYEDALWLSYLFNDNPIPRKTVLIFKQALEV